MWFKPKAQHPDPEVRRQYVEQLAAGDAALTAVAQQDPHPDVRAAAVARLDSPQDLMALAQNDSDEQIRNRSMARLQQVLAGQASSAVTLDGRVQFISASSDLALVSYVLMSGVEPDLRKAALDRAMKVSADGQLMDLLCQVAAGDPIGEIREAAAQPIHDEDHLQKLIEKVRGRDKAVLRMAQQRLDKLQRNRAAVAQLDDCALQAKRLAESEQEFEAALVQSRINKLNSEWQQAVEDLSEPQSAQVRQQFKQAIATIEQRLQQLKDQRTARAEILSELSKHLEQPDNTPQVAELSQRWHQTGTASNAETRQFDELIHRVHEADSMRQREAERLSAAEQIVAVTTEAIQSPFTEKDVARLRKRWEQAQLPQDVAEKNDLQQRFEAAIGKLEQPLALARAEQEQLVQKIEAHLDAYEKALKEEQLGDAVSRHDKVLSALKSLESPSKAAALTKRLKAGEARMSELKRWRHWGTAQAREQLCEQAEALLKTELQPPEIARQVRICRDKWKALDKSDGAATKALWERFDKACEQAYGPCQEFFEQQKKVRAGNLERREALCAQLEQIESETDWSAPPWREVSDTLGEIQRQWQRAGAVDRRVKKEIEKRFRDASAAVEQRVSQMRDTETKRRRDLIGAIEALAADTDARDSVDKVKQAQRNWKPLVQADKKTERQLWKQFRTACDAIFDQRKKQFEQADQERELHLAERASVCSQIEELADALDASLAGGSLDANAVEETRKKLSALRTGWQRIGPAPRNKQNEIEQKFRTATERLGKLGRKAEATLEQTALAELERVAKLCNQLEQAVAAGDVPQDNQLAEIAAFCDENSAAKGLKKRLHKLKQACAGDDDAKKQIHGSLEQNRKTKLQLCMEMEIVADIESPADYQQERMQFRVQQLSASLAGTVKAKDAESLQREWYATGAAPVEYNEALEQRFAAACKALGSD